ncbi:cholesterol side-chain cleavage enzyme, mitochondrial-like [Pleurodeles waltl]|uniref:cholesterol side-chain cleavage enzyme, mitochondrial-like n=1 Tax=Pleurodeles waltl TaxID=8319 RepID=UPI00370970D2
MSLHVIDQFLPLLNEVDEDIMKRIHLQIQRSGCGRWTADLSNELFRFGLESVSYLLYGKRLGLLEDCIDPEAQQFIDAITKMFQTTSPMLFIPPKLLGMINSKIWTDHIEAWDVIFSQADKCIHNIYMDLKLNQKNRNKYSGVLANLLLQDKLPIDDIKATVTELMAGGVDTLVFLQSPESAASLLPSEPESSASLPCELRPATCLTSVLRPAVCLPSGLESAAFLPSMPGPAACLPSVPQPLDCLPPESEPPHCLPSVPKPPDCLHLSPSFKTSCLQSPSPQLTCLQSLQRSCLLSQNR